MFRLIIIAFSLTVYVIPNAAQTEVGRYRALPFAVGTGVAQDGFPQSIVLTEDADGATFRLCLSASSTGGKVVFFDPSYGDAFGRERKLVEVFRGNCVDWTTGRGLAVRYSTDFPGVGRGTYQKIDP